MVAYARHKSVARWVRHNSGVQHGVWPGGVVGQLAGVCQQNWTTGIEKKVHCLFCQWFTERQVAIPGRVAEHHQQHHLPPHDSETLEKQEAGMFKTAATSDRSRAGARYVGMTTAYSQIVRVVEIRSMPKMETTMTPVEKWRWVPDH